MRKGAVIFMVLGLAACTSHPEATPESGEMTVAKSALSACLYDILPKGSTVIRPKGQWVINQDDVSADGVPIVRAVNGADRSREAALNTCVRKRTLSSPEFHEARARAL